MFLSLSQFTFSSLWFPKSTPFFLAELLIWVWLDTSGLAKEQENRSKIICMKFGGDGLKSENRQRNFACRHYLQFQILGVPYLCIDTFYDIDTNISQTNQWHFKGLYHFKPTVVETFLQLLLSKLSLLSNVVAVCFWCNHHYHL